MFLGDQISICRQCCIDGRSEIEERGHREKYVRLEIAYFGHEGADEARIDLTGHDLSEYVDLLVSYGIVAGINPLEGEKRLRASDFLINPDSVVDPNRVAASLDALRSVEKRSGLVEALSEEWVQYFEEFFVMASIHGGFGVREWTEW